MGAGQLDQRTPFAGQLLSLMGLGVRWYSTPASFTEDSLSSERLNKLVVLITNYRRNRLLRAVAFRNRIPITIDSRDRDR